MRILWVGKRPGDGVSGDEIYDRKIIAEAEAGGAHITRVYPQRVSRAVHVANLIKGIAHYRNLYDSESNRLALRKAASESDVAICSWEPFDRLATTMPCPVIPILHNITSIALRSMLPRSPLAWFLAAQASEWERAAYATSSFPIVAVLSNNDREHLSKLRSSTTILYAPPGMPRLASLTSSAKFKAEILISGTFGWYPKRRDLDLFSREYSALKCQFPVFADTLPNQIRQTLSAKPMISKFDDGIRVGLIPDRFVAGHKLKATFYIANNAIVLSYANVASEFSNIEDHEFFVRKIDHASDVERHVAEIEALASDLLLHRMEVFKRRCAERFAWFASANALLEAAKRERRG